MNVPHLGHGKAPSPSIFVRSIAYMLSFLTVAFFIIFYFTSFVVVFLRCSMDSV